MFVKEGAGLKFLMMADQRSNHSPILGVRGNEIPWVGREVVLLAAT
jgi:hypothetical protein